MESLAQVSTRITCVGLLVRTHNSIETATNGYEESHSPPLLYPLCSNERITQMNSKGAVPSARLGISGAAGIRNRQHTQLLTKPMVQILRIIQAWNRAGLCFGEISLRLRLLLCP